MAGFNTLDALNTRHQFALLGGLPASVVKGSAEPISTTVLVDRDIDVVVDSGLSVTRGTVISVLTADVGRLRQGDRITVNPDDPDQMEYFTVSDPLADDGVVTRVHVRG